MQQLTEQRPMYGNWVSKRLLYIFGLPSVAIGALSIVFSILIIPTLIFLSCFLYFVYAHYRFSPSGGNVQRRVQDLVLEHLDWDGVGKVIDIGCGNGRLSIEIAKKYSNAEVIGIDYWGGMWEYGKAICERNAVIEGISSRVRFQRASAISLPFDSDIFDVVVSNLVFHEIRSISDKKDAIFEALRVLRKGGMFVLQDLFLWKRIYGEIDELLATMRSWGLKNVQFEPTCEKDFIPKALKLSFML
ncbi:MAG: class I SAM-dependent methyltransferase, partial [Candidatus Thorarchaeota archaeon]|nr:class I SAM-dependent methyltransferase [Candidatus Thorarchaeota archaeon]